MGRAAYKRCLVPPSVGSGADVQGVAKDVPSRIKVPPSAVADAVVVENYPVRQIAVQGYAHLEVALGFVNVHESPSPVFVHGDSLIAFACILRAFVYVNIHERWGRATEKVLVPQGIPDVFEGIQVSWEQVSEILCPKRPLSS